MATSTLADLFRSGGRYFRLPLFYSCLEFATMHMSVRYANHTREPYEFIEVELDTIMLDDLTIRTTHFDDNQWGTRPEGSYWQWNRLYDVARYIHEQLYSDAGNAGMSKDEILYELEVLTRQVLLLRKNREFENPGRNV